MADTGSIAIGGNEQGNIQMRQLITPLHLNCIVAELAWAPEPKHKQRALSLISKGLFDFWENENDKRKVLVNLRGNQKFGVVDELHFTPRLVFLRAKNEDKQDSPIWWLHLESLMIPIHSWNFLFLQFGVINYKIGNFFQVWNLALCYEWDMGVEKSKSWTPRSHW